jgi:SulP family sulfate permease
MLATVFVLAPVMSRIPLAALAGLLLVTAWRMIEWDAVRFLIRHRFQFSLTALFLTLLGTLVLDLTQAVLVGVFFSGAIFLSQIANLTIDVQKVDPARLDGYPAVDACRLEHIRVAYLTGPLFFAAVGHLNEALAALDLRVHLILSMRGVPLIDTTGAEALLAWVERIQAAGGRVMLVGLQPAVTNLLAKAEILHRIGPENIFWSADQAILAAARCPDPPTLDPLAEPGLLEQV